MIASTHRRTAVTAIAAAFLACTGAGHAQSWRTFTAARDRGGAADSLTVRVTFGAGTLSVRDAAAPSLYDLRLRYDANRTRPVRRYDAATHTLVVLSDSALDRPLSLNFGRRGMTVGSADDRGSDMSLALGRGIPIGLALDVGACDADLQLGGLTLTALSINGAASDVHIAFGTPNPDSIAEMELHTVAADLHVSTLGNAHARRVQVSATVGGVDLDLAGEWTGTMTIDVHAVLGGVTLRVPADVGVQAQTTKVLGEMDAPFLTARNGTYESDNWTTAARKLVVLGGATVGNLSIVRE